MFARQPRSLARRSGTRREQPEVEEVIRWTAPHLAGIGIAFSFHRDGVSGSSNRPAPAASYTLTGSSFQMSRAYSEIVRSLENLPIRAVLRIAIRAQRAGSRNAASTFLWHSL